MKVVITGASRGLGKAMAIKFATEGYELCLVARNQELLSKLQKELLPSNNATLIIADLSQKEETKAAAQQILSQFGVPDILINNAGTFLPGSVAEEEEGVLESMLQNNLMSAYHFTRAFLPSMKARRTGHIFNMCSIASLQAYANGGSYSISKFALLGFSKNLREELKPHHIKVTAIMPGAVYTDSWAGSEVDPHRIMEAEDISKMVLAMSQLSPQACVEDIVIRPQLGDL